MAPGDSSPPNLRRLATAVASTAPDRAGGWLFVGWDETDLPVATWDRRRLGQRAQRAFGIFRQSGLWPRQVEFRSVTAVEYILTGPAVDFADQGDRIAEDRVQYVVLDEAGERREIVLGELAVLETIVKAREPWQSVATLAGPEFARSAAPFHTLFTRLPGGTADEGLAMLFRPTLPEAGNEAAFKSFVRQTLSRLLVLDESQPRGQQKGYLRAAADRAGLGPRGGLLGALGWLREAGLVEFSDDWLRGLARRRDDAQVAIFRILRALGIVEITDEGLADIENPPPDYDLDPLDTGGLVDLAEAMYWAGRDAIHPGGVRT